MDEKQGVGKGVLTQPGDLGGGLWHISLNDWTQWLRDGRPVSVSLRLLLSLSMMLTTDLWTEPPGLHSCDRGILKQPPGKWISNVRLTHYQALLLDAPRISFQ